MKRLIVSAALVILSCFMVFAQSVTITDAMYEEGDSIFWMVSPDEEVEFSKEYKTTLKSMNFHFKNMDKLDSDRIYHGKKALLFSEEALDTINSFDETDFWCHGYVHMFKKSDDIAVGDKTNSQWLDEKVDGWITILYPGKFKYLK